MDLTKASKKYQEYCGADKHQSENNKKEIHASYNQTPCNPLKKYKYVTLRSLLLVRKSVEGFKMAVMALASSSCTVRVVEDVYGSVLNTNCVRHMHTWYENPFVQTQNVDGESRYVNFTFTYDLR